MYAVIKLLSGQGKKSASLWYILGGLVYLQNSLFFVYYFIFP